MHALTTEKDLAQAFTTIFPGLVNFYTISLIYAVFFGSRRIDNIDQESPSFCRSLKLLDIRFVRSKYVKLTSPGTS